MEFIKKILKRYVLNFSKEDANLIVLLGLLCSLVGAVIAVSDNISCLRFTQSLFVPSVYRLNEGLDELTSFPLKGKHATLSREEIGFDEILEVIRKYDLDSSKEVIQITNRKEHPITFYWSIKGDQSAIFLDLVEKADSQNEVYPINYTSEVLRWIANEKSTQVVTRGFVWILIGVFFDLIGLFIHVRLRRRKDQMQEEMPNPAQEVRPIQWSPEMEQRLQYVNGLYDRSREHGIQIIKVMFSAAIVIAGVPIVFYDKVQEIFNRAIFFIHISWILLLLGMLTAFLAYLMLVEGFYHHAIAEDHRNFSDGNPQRFQAAFEKTNQVFNAGHWLGISGAVFFSLSLLCVVIAIVKLLS